jgi:hypothetical protein
MKTIVMRTFFAFILLFGISAHADIAASANQIKGIADSIIAEAGNPPQGNLPAIIVSPKPNFVYQRYLNSTVGFSSAVGTATFKVEYRGTADMCRLRVGGVVHTERTDCQFTNLSAGWYQLYLVTNGVEGDMVNFGVGDVYGVFGQSNAVFTLQPWNATVAVPQPGKVILSDYGFQGRDYFRDVGLQPLVAEAENKKVSGAGWLYAGIALNRSYPVMFVIQAQGNTSTTDWVSGLQERIYRTWAYHRPRAMLWHQGESDSVLGISQTTSYNNMYAFMSSLRQLTAVKWIVAKNSVNPPGYAPIRAAQQQLIDNLDYVELGPDTDTIRNNAINPDNEFYVLPAANQAEQFGNMWAARINALGL